MPFFPTLPLQTPRLMLRELEVCDWERILYLRSDPQVNALVKRPLSKSKEAAIAFIKNTIENNRLGRATYWGIVSPDTNEVMGCVCLWKFSDDQTTAEIGYDLSVAAQGKGYMTEAMNAVLEFGFATLDLRTIEACTQSNNESSIRLLRKFGFCLLADRKDLSNSLNSVFALHAENSGVRKQISNAPDAG